MLNSVTVICTKIGKLRECRICYNKGIVKNHCPSQPRDLLVETDSWQVKDSMTMGKTSLSAGGIVVVPAIASLTDTSSLPWPLIGCPVFWLLVFWSCL